MCGLLEPIETNHPAQRVFSATADHLQAARLEDQSMNEPLHLPNAYERERDTKLRDDARAAAVGFRALGRGADAVRMDEVAEFHASKLLPRTVALLSVQTWRAGPDDEGYPTRRPDDYEVVVHCGCGVEPKTMTTNEAQADINCQ